jgi:intracellular sulfur oxidation DsrE/DsrF family protein
LVDAAHERAGGGSNPNRQLVEKLSTNGVEVWVCGQSVICGGHALSDVLPGVKVRPLGDGLQHESAAGRLGDPGRLLTAARESFA